MESEAFREAAEQLYRPGNDGRVWINRWAERYAELGTQREFFERSSDVFKVVPGEDRRYTVELTQEGIEKAEAEGVGAKLAGTGAGASQPKPWVTKAPSRSWGSNAVSGNGAVSGGCKGGKSAGNAYRNSAGSHKGGAACATWKGGQTGGSTSGKTWKGGKSGKNTWGNSKGGGAWLALPAAPGWNMGSYNGKGFGNSAQHKDSGSLALAAIREIEVQLRSPKDEREGHVWIEGWGHRYQWALGSLREFLDSRPDKFVVIPGQGRRYTVSLVNRGFNAKGGCGGCKGVKRPAGTSPPWQTKPATVAKRVKTEQDVEKLQAKVEQVEKQPSDNVDDLFAEAIDEVARQLEEAGGEGNVWIQDWGRRFQKKLGTLRDFLDQHSDTFKVIPGQGKKFTVKIL